MRRIELSDDDALTLHKLAAVIQESWAREDMEMVMTTRAIKFWGRIKKATKPRSTGTPTKPIEEPKKKGTK